MSHHSRREPGKRQPPPRHQSKANQLPKSKTSRTTKIKGREKRKKTLTHATKLRNLSVVPVDAWLPVLLLQRLLDLAYEELTTPTCRSALRPPTFLTTRTGRPRTPEAERFAREKTTALGQKPLRHHRQRDVGPERSEGGATSDRTQTTTPPSFYSFWRRKGAGRHLLASAAIKTYRAVLHIVIVLGKNKRPNVPEVTTRSIAAPPSPPPLTLPKQFAMEICDVEYLRTMSRTAVERGGNDSNSEKSRREKTPAT